MSSKADRRYRTIFGIREEYIVAAMMLPLLFGCLFTEPFIVEVENFNSGSPSESLVYGPGGGTGTVSFNISKYVVMGEWSQDGIFENFTLQLCPQAGTPSNIRLYWPETGASTLLWGGDLNTCQIVNVDTSGFEPYFATEMAPVIDFFLAANGSAPDLGLNALMLREPRMHHYSEDVWFTVFAPQEMPEELIYNLTGENFSVISIYGFAYTCYDGDVLRYETEPAEFINTSFLSGNITIPLIGTLPFTGYLNVSGSIYDLYCPPYIVEGKYRARIERVNVSIDNGSIFYTQNLFYDDFQGTELDNSSWIVFSQQGPEIAYYVDSWAGGTYDMYSLSQFSGIITYYDQPLPVDEDDYAVVEYNISTNTFTDVATSQRMGIVFFANETIPPGNDVEITPYVRGMYMVGNDSWGAFCPDMDMSGGPDAAGLYAPGWHTFGMNFTNDTQSYYVDGVNVLNCTNYTNEVLYSGFSPDPLTNQLYGNLSADYSNVTRYHKGVNWFITGSMYDDFTAPLDTSRWLPMIVNGTYADYEVENGKLYLDSLSESNGSGIISYMIFPLPTVDQLVANASLANFSGISNYTGNFTLSNVSLVLEIGIDSSDLNGSDFSSGFFFTNFTWPPFVPYSFINDSFRGGLLTNGTDARLICPDGTLLFQGPMGPPANYTIGFVSSNESFAFIVDGMVMGVCPPVNETLALGLTPDYSTEYFAMGSSSYNNVSLGVSVFINGSGNMWMDVPPGYADADVIICDCNDPWNRPFDFNISSDTAGTLNVSILNISYENLVGYSQGKSTVRLDSSPIFSWMSYNSNITDSIVRLQSGIGDSNIYDSKLIMSDVDCADVVSSNLTIVIYATKNLSVYAEKAGGSPITIPWGDLECGHIENSDVVGGAFIGGDIINSHLRGVPIMLFGDFTDAHIENMYLSEGKMVINVTKWAPNVSSFGIPEVDLGEEALPLGCDESAFFGADGVPGFTLKSANTSTLDCWLYFVNSSISIESINFNNTVGGLTVTLVKNSTLRFKDMERLFNLRLKQPMANVIMYDLNTSETGGEFILSNEYQYMDNNMISMNRTNYTFLEGKNVTVIFLEVYNDSDILYYENFTRDYSEFVFNGTVCGPSKCMNKLYDPVNHTLTFTVNNFSTYGLARPFNGSWDWIRYPEGVYEPYTVGLPGTHLHTFPIRFYGLNATAGTLLKCNIMQSNGTIFTVSSSMPTNYINADYALNYTIQSSDSINSQQRWKVLNCSLEGPLGIIYYNDSAYGSRLNKTILVHGNTWTRFDTVNDDAYLASRCFLGIPKRYFNNTYYCDYVGDVAFSISMSTGFGLEGYCHDTIDNDNNGQTDCADRYCRGIPYTCINHTWAGDPFEGVCQNGLCWETKSFGGHDITYYYNRYIPEGGTLKIRFDGGNYATTKPISYAIADINGYVADGTYTDSYELPDISRTATSYIAEDPDGYTGDIDMVMWVNLSGNYTAGNWYDVSIYMVHEGYDLLVTGIPVYITNAAPSAWDENDTGYERTLPCASDIDEDLNYFIDCADANCDGAVAGANCTGGDALCQFGAETTCYDCFDNDRNGQYDCGDASCDLLPGDYTNMTVLCHVQGEGAVVYDPSPYPWTMACADIFDNDQDTIVDCWDHTFCWGRGGTSIVLPCPAFENNTNLWCHDHINNDYDARMDCQDYDCHGVNYNNATFNATCPTDEAYDEFGNYVPAQCFDLIDNDLDSPTQQWSGLGDNIDCADADCIGVIDPISGRTCLPYEYNLTLNITKDYCANGIDDDADNYKGWPDGGIDCSDPDCHQMFGNCGPCPEIENITWDSCANSLDDNNDLPVSLTDCQDPDCLGEIGSTESAQRCAANENTDDLCSDGFDNDADGYIDCLDASCNGHSFCQYGTETTCNDNRDNNANGYIDCADSDCYGSAPCSSKLWFNSVCTTVPATSAWETVGSSTIEVRHLYRHFINTDYVVEITGTEDYDSLTITLGDATVLTDHFPYDATTCNLTGDTTLVRWVSSDSRVGQLQDQGAFTGGFSVTLTCAGIPGVETNSYPLIAANELSGGSTENGELTLTASTYEDTAPTMTDIEPEPLSGTSNVNIDYGTSFMLRGVPSIDLSGICQCSFDVDGTVSTTNGNCRYTSQSQTDDDSIIVSAAARDGAGNLGGYGGVRTLNINVMPVQNSISVDRADPFYNATGGDAVLFTSSFTTASSGSINACTARIEDSAGITVDTQAVTPSGGSTASCNGNFDISLLADGIYYLVIDVTDEDADTITSDRKAFYVCSDYDSSGTDWTCQFADYDGDGSPDPFNCDMLPTPSLDITLRILLLSPGATLKTISIYQSNTSTLIYQNSTNGDEIVTTLPQGVYNIELTAYDSAIGVMFNQVALNENKNYTVILDYINPPVYGLKTYTIDSDVDMSDADITLSYAGITAEAENHTLGLERCGAWNYTAHECNSTWTSLASTQNTTAETFTATVTGFSGFSVMNSTSSAMPPGNGHDLKTMRIDWSFVCPGNILRLSATDRYVLPVSNARVAAQYDYGTHYSPIGTEYTDSDGYAEFTISQEGTYRASVSKDGYQSEEALMTVDELCPPEEEVPEQPEEEPESEPGEEPEETPEEQPEEPEPPEEIPEEEPEGEVTWPEEEPGAPEEEEEPGECVNLFGICWYWWVILLILLAIAAAIIGGVIFAIGRKKGGYSPKNRK